MTVYYQINMKSLDLFLKALETTFNNKRGIYVPRKVYNTCKFPAYKELLLEVWCIDGEYKTLVSKVNIVNRCTTEEEKAFIEDAATIETIKNILNYYGIQ